MIIIGIDPGSRHTGYGIIRKNNNKLQYIASGVISPGNNLDLDEKLVIIYDKLIEIIEQYHPDEGSIERIFHSVNAKSSLVLGHARGVAILAMKKQSINVSEYAAREVKAAVVGSGKASKDQVQQMVKILVNHRQPMKEDESDALAIAVCHAHSQTFQSTLKTSGVL